MGLNKGKQQESGQSIIDVYGLFVHDLIVEEGPMSFHILNYNSPGTTGFLPFPFYIVKQIHDKGILNINQKDVKN